MDKGLGYFSKGDTQMANKHIKRFLTALDTRQMQFKTTMIQHLSHTMKAMIKKKPRK